MTFEQEYRTYERELRESGKTADRENSPFLKDLKKLLEKCGLMRKNVSVLRSEETAKQIRESLVREIRKDFWKKEDLLRITNDFFKSFFEEWGDADGNAKFISSDKFYDDCELDIKLLKYLQSGEDETVKKTRDQIQRHFSISDKSLNKHLDKLRYGECRLLGEPVQIELRRTNNTYDSTIHPVFMTLDLADVYFLSVVVPRLAEGTGYRETALKIASKTYQQMSSYAREVIDPIANKEGIDYRITYNSLDWNLPFFEKSGKPCTLLYGDAKEPLSGHFEMSSDKNFVLDTGEKIHVDYRKILEVRKNA
jgi:hypothetical protein